MRKIILASLLACILFLCGSLYAIEVYETGCTVEIYATYPQTRETRALVFDDTGYLYATHDLAGSIWRIAPNGTASEFVTGFVRPIGIVWAGGTNFGNNLYVLDSETFRGDIYRVDQDGVKTIFEALNADAPSPMALDRTGNYGGALYVGSTGDDSIYKINAAGNESIFSNFPYSRSGGGPQAIAFDVTGNYGGLMYVGTSFREYYEDVSGLFALDTEANVTRFSDDLVQVRCIAFAPSCAFGSDMFAIGKDQLENKDKLWRIDTDGHATEFASSCNDIVFGPNGAMYISEVSEAGDMIIVSRIISRNSYYVDAANGDDLNNGTSSQSAFATIQKAIDTAPEGYTIFVKPGEYYEPIDFRGKAITIQGLAGPAGVPVLEVPDDFAVFFINNEGPDTILKNIIIKNSFMGIFLVGSSPTISNVTIVDNIYGISAYTGANPDISNSIFWNNLNGDLYGCEARYSWMQSQLGIDATYPQTIPDLVHYWSFDEGHDNIINDVISDKNGDIVGASWTDGVSGSALTFDGIDDYIALPDNEPVWLPQNNFTVSVWIYFEREPEYSTNEVILDLNYANSDNSSNELGYNLLFSAKNNSKQLVFQMHTTSTTDEDLRSDLSIVPNQWYHVTIARNGTTQSMYINGQLNVTRQCSPDSIKFYGGYDDNRINIGRFTTTLGSPRYHFKGKLDELMIFDRALTNREIMQLYEHGGYGNIADSPLFADPVNGDYHLKSERGRYWPEHDVWVLDKVSSPCLDGGDPLADSSQEPMPNGGCINMGAYGGTSYASMNDMPFPEPDYNMDGIIDKSDLAELIEQWLAVSGWLEY